MTDSTFPVPRARSAESSTRIAWAVLLGAFAVFCVLCAFTAYGIHYFVFLSTVPMQVSLDVGRGTAAYLLSGDPDENVAPQTGHYLLTNERIRLDPQSQATIFFRDTYQENRLVAAVTMKGGASLFMGHALRPRFEWSSVEYRIDLQNLSGEVDVFVPEGLDRAFWLSLRTPEGAYVYLTESGQYTITASSAQLQVDNRDGRSFLIAPARSNPRLVSAGERGTISFGENAEVQVGAGPVNLLQTAEFLRMDSRILPPDVVLPDLVWPWQCGDSQSPPPGRYGLGFPDGRPAIQLYRADATSHGETGCSQSPWPGQRGLDVTGYSSLILKTTFYIEDHSLPVCGYEGSECPLMLQLDYVFQNEEGEEEPNQWYHGFYVKPDPSQTSPTRCSSCLIAHDPVYGGTWYTYESQNLFNLVPEGQRPASLLRVRFYASGHEYDVYVGDVALFAS